VKSSKSWRRIANQRVKLPLTPLEDEWKMKRFQSIESKVQQHMRDSTTKTEESRSTFDKTVPNKSKSPTAVAGGIIMESNVRTRPQRPIHQVHEYPEGEKENVYNPARRAQREEEPPSESIFNLADEMGAPV